MAQAFVSTYKNHYRWNSQPRVQLYDPYKLTKLEPEGDIWMLDPNREIEEELKNLPKIKEAIHNLHLERMRSTYKVLHCDNLKSHKKSSDPHRSKSINTVDEEREDPELGNELLEYCKNLYNPKSRKFMPPLNSARNVFGYMRPTRLLTPLTVYQHEYGRVGYGLLTAELKKNEQELINK